MPHITANFLYLNQKTNFAENVILMHTKKGQPHSDDKNECDYPFISDYQKTIILKPEYHKLRQVELSANLKCADIFIFDSPAIPLRSFHEA